MLLIGLLLNTKHNAHELANFIESNHISKLIKISPPAVYKNCKRMYKAGLLDGKNIKDGEAPEKVIYSVNKKGEEYFFELMEHYSNEIKPFFFDHNAFFWCIENLNKKDGLKMLTTLASSITSLKEWMITNESHVNENGSFGGKALVKQYRMILETMEIWINEIIGDYIKF